MECGSVFDDDSHMTNVLFKNDGQISCTSHVLDSIWVPNCSSPSFQASASMVNFEDIRPENETDRQIFTQISNKQENYNEDFDGSFHQPEKKRRLLPEQVQYLEKSFELENKLEPERKIQLAKELGLQPRQVTIWFQNRRARYRTKQLEKEYDTLKASFDKLKEDCDTLVKDNEKLKNEVHFLKEKLLLRENGKPKLEPIMNPMDLHPKTNPISAALDTVPVMTCKLETAASSAKSDVLDSDSQDGNHSALLEPADSSHVFEPDPSDFTHEDDNDSLSRSLIPPLCFPKLETECYDDLQPNSCNFGFPVQDQGTWFWQY